MELNTYGKGFEAFSRALKVVPGGIYGHQGPAEGCYIPSDAFPRFSARAQGTYFWDLDGNRFVDYMCGYGPNVLGYGDPDVNAAALRQLAIEDCVTIPSFKMVEFAELLVDTVASADWAFFCKNGGDTTTLAIMAARAHTRRKKIVFVNGYYHGVAMWTQKIDYPGIIPEDVANNLYVDWNDLPGLERVLAENDGEVAAFISTPYMHGNFADNELPAPGYWARVRELCDQHGIVLIVDDVRAGFRLDLAGSDHYYGFKADLICFCKAIANGWNVSALCGRDHLKTAVAGLTYTGSYWLSAVPFAAGMACVSKLKEIDGPSEFAAKGRAVTALLREAAAEHGFNLVVSGEPALFYLRLADDDSLMLHQEWIAECVKRGVFLTNHHNHFINHALVDADVAFTAEVAAEAFQAVRRRHPL